jgi:hypothetical protein
LTQVRVVTRSATLPDDPDKSEMPDRALKGVPIIYGTLKDSKDIFVWLEDRSLAGREPIPMDVYSGIAVDSYFLWMYGRDGFACATHASVMICINKKLATPRWLGGKDNPGNIAGVLDLYSCEDRTLLVSTADNVSTAVYRVDLTKMTLVIEPWEKFPNGAERGASQVRKVPVYGWQQIERLSEIMKQSVSKARGDNYPS